MPERELTAEDCEAILAHECDEPRGLESSDLYDDRPAEEPKCECGHDRAMHRRTDHGYICGCLTYRPPTTEPASEGIDDLPPEANHADDCLCECCEAFRQKCGHDIERSRWVAVESSEDLPKRFGDYITTRIKNTDGSGLCVRESYFDPNNPVLVEIWMEVVKAWQPKPEPYTPKEQI